MDTFMGFCTAALGLAVVVLMWGAIAMGSYMFIKGVVLDR